LEKPLNIKSDKTEKNIMYLKLIILG
jgi:hypothetical protein